MYFKNMLRGIGWVCLLLVSFTSIFALVSWYPGGSVQTADERTSISSPDELGFSDSERETIRERARKLSPLQNLVISQNNQTVLEFHRNSNDQNEAVNVKSASKSVLSALVGIAIDEGHIHSVSQPLIDYFPALLAEASPRKKSITIRDLLLMRSGLESTSFENYGPWVSSDNWLKYALKGPIVAPPGSTTDYSTGNSHIVSAILSRATGRDLRDYAQEKLFDPLNVRIGSWQRSPEGYRFGGNNLYLTPRALLRFGQLFLNEGRWKGQRVISRSWVRQSTARIVHDTEHGYPYGYFWWNHDTGNTNVTFAWGHGGQFVFIIPDRELVVVTTSSLESAPGDTRNYTRKVIHSLLEEHIVPFSVRGSN